MHVTAACDRGSYSGVRPHEFLIRRTVKWLGQHSRCTQSYFCFWACYLGYYKCVPEGRTALSKRSRRQKIRRRTNLLLMRPPPGWHGKSTPLMRHSMSEPIPARPAMKTSVKPLMPDPIGKHCMTSTVCNGKDVKAATDRARPTLNQPIPTRSSVLRDCRERNHPNVALAAMSLEKSTPTSYVRSTSKTM